MQQLVIADQVLPGPAGQLVTDGAVLIEDTTILAVGPRNQIEPMADASAQRRTFPDGTVLPGLINAHVHLSWGLALVVEEAHAAGLPIAAHAHGTDAIGLPPRQAWTHSNTVRGKGERILAPICVTLSSTRWPRGKSLCATPIHRTGGLFNGSSSGRNVLELRSTDCSGWTGMAPSSFPGPMLACRPACSTTMRAR